MMFKNYQNRVLCVLQFVPNIWLKTRAKCTTTLSCTLGVQRQFTHVLYSVCVMGGELARCVAASCTQDVKDVNKKINASNALNRDPAPHLCFCASKLTSVCVGFEDNQREILCQMFCVKIFGVDELRPVKDEGHTIAQSSRPRQTCGQDIE